MDPKHRIVTKLPLDVLWNKEGEIEASRERFMRKSEIASFIRAAPAEFVVADVGHPLRWISVGEGAAFLKKEAERSIVDDPDEPIDLS